jgi:iron complex outermembrane receptor protein
MMKPRLTLAVATLAGAALAGEAAAQSIDRNALEELAGEPITLSATGAPLRVTDAPVNMTIITQEEIRRSGAIDIPGVLERLANVDVMRSSRGQADVSIRGYNTTMSPRLLVLVNGRQVYSDHYGVTSWETIPVQLAEIHQIEVVSGPNTALFGFNAVAGVVNIVTVDTLHDDVDALSVRAGDPHYIGGEAVWTARISDDLGLRLSLGGYESDAFEGDSAVTQPLLGQDAADPTRNAAALNVGYDINPRVRADFEATWSEIERSERFFFTATNQEAETTSVKVALSAETGLGMATAQAYLNQGDLYADTVGGPTTLDVRTLVASAALVGKPAPAHTLRGGVEYRRNEMSQGFGDEIAYDLYALSGMWNWQLTDALAFTSAARVDTLQLERSGPQAVPGYPISNAEHDRDMTETSFNLGLVYRLTAADSLRLSAARGIGSPSLAEYGIQTGTTLGPLTLFFGGDPAIDPTTVDNVEFGWDHDLTTLSGRLRASVFWQRTDGPKVLGATNIFLGPTTIFTVADNIGESEMTGLELGVDGESGRFQWRAQYSWRNIEDDITASPFMTGLDYEGSSPEHVFTGGVLWVGNHWEVGADARYTSETVQYSLVNPPNPLSLIPTDSYVQANMHVAWLPVDSLRVELSGRDLLDDSTQTVGISPVERSVYLSVSHRFGQSAAE